MRVNREVQNKLLNLAADAYPLSVSPMSGGYIDELDEMVLVANLKYLIEQEFIRPYALSESMDGMFSLGPIEITKNGLDFLLGDEGITAILNVVTVKFEANTLKAILENKINQSHVSPENKKSMIDALQELPAESIKHLTMKLLDEGLANLPNAILLIGMYLGIS